MEKAKAKKVESKEGDWVREDKEQGKGYVCVSSRQCISSVRKFSPMDQKNP